MVQNAKNSNKMAKILSTKLSRLNSIEITYPTESNEVFVKIQKVYKIIYQKRLLCCSR